MKDLYIFPAIFDYDDDVISIEFPDLPGCLPCAHSDKEALRNAKEAMALHLWGMERDGDDLPEPTPVQHILLYSHQTVMLIECWMPPFRDKMTNKAVNKTLTIPKWLDDLAREHNVNFSHILQDALKQYLGVDDRHHV